MALPLVWGGLPAVSSAEPAYSPYAEATYPTRVLWGDTHLHTTNSLDARTAGVTLDVEDAYRFARGETVTATSGQPAKLSRPLDFLVVTDHSDAMGVVDQVIRGNPELLANPELRALHDEFNKGSEGAATAMEYISRVLLEGGPSPLLDPALMRSTWEQYVETADRFNDPGRFTALIGYEWTPTISGDKLHRNVLYRGDAASARRLLPFTAAESIHPEALWRWMQRYEDETGGRVLALAHNGNLGNGKMFPVEINPNTGTAIDAEYVKNRARWEPLFEVTQIKGDSEAHPYLSPADEFADFESWDRGNTMLTAPKDPNMLQYEYAREALKNGLKLERQLGSNPYRFGMVGSTDSHTGMSTAEESNFFGKMANNEPRRGRLSEPMFPADGDTWQNWETSASGYAAVWATENTREAIWDAMARREVYATTGPRMTVRFFGGWDFSQDDASFQLLAARGYAKGVPMGGTLPSEAAGLHSGSAGKAPTFLVGALKDPLSGHLDRIQIIKGWLDADGVTHERVFNVAWGDAHERGLQPDGKLPAVGNTVNVADASWTNTIGDAELVGFWRDPAFDPSQPAVYYVRVIEIPTPRWVAYDAKRFDEEIPADAPAVIQERAYTSPIWYSPLRRLSIAK
ncbi:MAG: DUF3604 domain-containing protein [Gammaproteobacteria bacterium]|nr:DUF3604 domain-containing protein [Gammaproteobacteria bacterium]